MLVGPCHSNQKSDAQDQSPHLGNLLYTDGITDRFKNKHHSKHHLLAAAVVIPEMVHLQIESSDEDLIKKVLTG